MVTIEGEEYEYINLLDVQEAEEKKKGIVIQFLLAMKQILRDPCSRYTLIAGSFRFFGGYCIAFFKPIYF